MSTQIEPTAHHPDGPSTFTARAICACFDGEHDPDDLDVAAYAALEEDTDEENEDDEEEVKKEDVSPAARGQAQHKALAKYLVGEPDPFADLAEWEMKQVLWVAEEVIQHAAAMGYGRSEIQTEQRVTLLGPSWNVLYFGTLDIRYGPFICDAKFGDMRNYFPQLAGYGLAVMEADEVDRLFLRTIYGRWRKAQQYVLDRQTAEPVVYGILRRRHSKDKHPVLCEFCGWCKHKLTCSAVNGVVDAVLSKREDWAMRLPTAHVSLAHSNPVTLGAMRFLWKAYIEPWGKSVEYASATMADGGGTILGFDKRPEKGRVRMDSSLNVAKVLVASGLKIEDVLGAAKLTMSKLAQAYHARFGGTKAEAARVVEKALLDAGVIRRGDPTFKLIRSKTAEDDIRAALARPVSEVQPPLLAGQ